ncbi:DUF3923 family protein [Bacillus sp. SM2101]|uniref:DUF3923 family protein n=1 Tax=Bacillus sp. SM2101 TaxID=2805366 RepID=UPI001BDEAA07
MRISWIAWWIVNASGLLLFAIGYIYLTQRNVDATGAVQTPEIIMLNITVLVAAFVIPSLFQLVWLIVMISKKSNRNKKARSITINYINLCFLLGLYLNYWR